MTHSPPKKIAHRGRLFPEIQWSSEEKARRKAENEVFHQRCRAIFEKVCPALIKQYYGWYIAIEPESGDYFIDVDQEVASQNAREKYPNAVHCMFCLNESGATGKI
jgi:hypothetical protein